LALRLIAFRRNGEVELINNATRKLLQIGNLEHINDLKTISPVLALKLLEIKHGENQLVRIQEKDDILQLAVYATEFNVHNRTITLVSIKNIQQELDEKEMESWQKLIQVLTHEIMNSIAPISSLSSTVSGIINALAADLKDSNEHPHLQESLNDVDQALQTIYKRADGLMHFVQTYRHLTKIPQPKFSVFLISSLFDGIITLMEREAKEKAIDLQVEITPPNLELSADEKLIEQVLINLVKNAIQALTDTPGSKILLTASMNRRGRIVIQVIDNGQGIEPHVLEKIFIPFFSTKPMGSGIGLSLSRQIMRMHGGNINAWSQPGHETRFTLTF
jgi:two-component system, NtrC family, nitrogen regulation sensor histidine kinase NtrY